MSISLRFKELKRLSLPKLNPWLLGLLVLVLVGGVSYVTYNQFVVVPRQRAKNKVQTATVGRSNLTDRRFRQWNRAARTIGECEF